MMPSRNYRSASLFLLSLLLIPGLALPLPRASAAGGGALLRLAQIAPGQAPPTPVTYPAPVPAPAGPNLLTNGDFSSGMSGWSEIESGYGSSRTETPLGSLPPQVQDGCLRLGVFGGYQEFFQEVGIDDLDLFLWARLRVEQWATQDGAPGGWAAVVLSFVDPGGRVLGSVYHYLNPNRTYISKPRALWIKLGTGEENPGGWFPVRADVRSLAGEMGLEADQVAGLRVSGRIFGTHEDRIQTIACFADFALTRGGGPAPPPPAGRLEIQTDRQSYLENEEIRVTVSGLPGNPKDWITIVPQGSPDDKYGQWIYTQGQPSGSWTFRGMAPGVYEVRVYFDYPTGGYQVQGRQSFSVEGAGAPSTYPPPAATLPLPPPTTWPSSGETTCQAWIEMEQTTQDLVGRNEEIRGDGVPDSEMDLQVYAPDRVVTEIVVENTDGRFSVWDTIPGNGHWALAVYSDQGRISRRDGSLAYLLGRYPERLRLFLQDNGSLSGGRTDFRVRVVFDDGSSCQAQCGPGSPPETTPSPPSQPSGPRVGGAETWLGTWEARETPEEGCPGPGPDGSRLWSFEVFRSGSGYGVEQVRPRPRLGRIVEITRRVVRFVLDGPEEREVFLVMKPGGEICAGSSLLQRPDRPGDPCAKSKQQAWKR